MKNTKKHIVTMKFGGWVNFLFAYNVTWLVAGADFETQN